LIPKGSTVIANHFTIFRDPAVYSPSPNLFIPERWLSSPSNTPPPEHFFGWGRRSCPGHQIARNSLFIAVARLVWAFEIEGVGEKPDPLMQTEGFSQGPVDFEVLCTVREGREKVVKSAWEGAEKDVDVLMKKVEEAQVVKG
jgi:cytochrome P450